MTHRPKGWWVLRLWTISEQGASMIVMKFGGTSVENETAISRVADIVHDRLDEQPVVVVSAMAGVTDALVAMSSAAASGALPEALKLLRKIRQRHLAVLSALVSGPREAAVRQEVQASARFDAGCAARHFSVGRTDSSQHRQHPCRG